MNKNEMIKLEINLNKEIDNLKETAIDLLNKEDFEKAKTIVILLNEKVNEHDELVEKIELKGGF